MKKQADIAQAIRKLTGAKKIIVKRGVPVILDEGIEMPEMDAINSKIQELNTEFEIQGTKDDLSDWLKEILDDVAKEYKYDNMLSVRTYTGYPNIFQKECVEMAMWASNSWYVLETIEEKVLNGDIEINTKEQLKEQLPAFVPSED